MVVFPNVYRIHHVLLLAGTLAVSWLGMQAAHEFGHVLGAWLTGGAVRKVVLLPWTLSRTELSVNPDPRTVAWAGPVVGALAPLLAWVVAAGRRWRHAYLLRFFAGFCLIANGAYLGGGAVEQLGDAGDLRRHGAELWQLFGFALLTVPAGLGLWHRQGADFGFGAARGRVDPRAAYAVAALAVLLVTAEILLNGE
jgi:hypothetical protein